MLLTGLYVLLPGLYILFTGWATGNWTLLQSNKPNSKNPQGGISEIEAPVDISNLSLLTSDGKITRTGYKLEDGEKVRISKKTNEVI